MVNRAFILSEIRRTAEENGGAPLGSRRFADATGIQKYDWFGKLWASWGDAVREAGFEPNSLRGRYEDADLLEHFAGLVKELGKFPSRGELRLKASQDAAFPSHNTFGRFGKRAELAKKVLEFCELNPELRAVADVCRPLAATEDAAPARGERAGKEPAFGSVYLIKAGRYFKIGRSNAVGRRERELAIQLPEKTKTVHIITTDDPAGIEHYWHRRFADRRGNGEWFELTAEDVRAFKRRKFM